MLHRLIVLLLFCGSACSDTTEEPRTPTEAAPEAAPEVEPEPASADPEPEPNDPDAVLFALVDGCYESNAADASAALTRCREGRARVTRYQQDHCECDTERVIEVRASDPIVFHLHFMSGTVGATPAAVRREAAESIERCRAAAESRAAHGRRAGDDEEQCDLIEWVRGPYTRTVEGLIYESPEVHRFLTESGVWVDEHGAPPCFVAGTQIATPSGARPIESLRVGDEVLAMDPSKGRRVRRRVLATKTRDEATVLQVQFEDGRRLGVTPNHPVFLADEETWRLAGELRVGERVVAWTGAATSLSITSIDLQPTPTRVYNLSVQGEHTYFAEGVLVHNY